MTQLLNNDEFAQVVRNAPLVAIDLIIRDPEQCVLVGLRMNEPANLCPAVRADAFVRIVKAETGLEASIGDANSSASMSTCTTPMYSGRRGSAHYIVLTHALDLDRRPPIVSDPQRSSFRWMTQAELISSPDVHQNTRAYFL